MNSDVKTRLQDSFITKRHDHVYTVLTSRSTTSVSTTTSSHIAYQDVSETSRQPFTKQDIIILGSVFCAVISLLTLITLLIICMFRRKSTAILPQWKRPMTVSPSNSQPFVNPININSDCNIQEYKQKLNLNHKLKPLHLVIKHQDYLNKKEKRNYRLQESTLRETHQSENSFQRFDTDTDRQENSPQKRINTRQQSILREHNFQKGKNKQNVRVKFNDKIRIFEDKFGNIDLSEITAKSIHDDLNEKKIDIKGKGKKVVEDNVSSNIKFYDDSAIYDIIQMFEILYGVNYSYI